jgi:hypothetical protein
MTRHPAGHSKKEPTPPSNDGSGMDMGEFSMPSIALAKTDAAEGSRAWFRDAIKEHGSTNPLKIEKRREKLTVWAQMIERTIKQVQLAKRAMLAEKEKQLKAIKAQRNAAKPIVTKDAQWDLETDRILFEMESQFNQGILSYEITLGNFIADLANIEGHCITIDCLTLREMGVSKSGKKGRVRHTAARYLFDCGYSSLTVLEILKHVFKDQLGEEFFKDDEDESAAKLNADDEDILSDEELAAEKAEPSE